MFLIRRPSKRMLYGADHDAYLLCDEERRSIIFDTWDQCRAVVRSARFRMAIECLPQPVTNVLPLENGTCGLEVLVVHQETTAGDEITI